MICYAMYLKKENAIGLNQEFGKSGLICVDKSMYELKLTINSRHTVVVNSVSVKNNLIKSHQFDNF